MIRRGGGGRFPFGPPVRQGGERSPRNSPGNPVTDGPDRKARDLEVVLEITRRLGAAVELDEILRLIIDRSMDLLDAERASIFLYEQASHELVSRVAAGEEEIRFPADKGVAGATVQDGQTLHVPDAYADERFNP